MIFHRNREWFQESIQSIWLTYSLFYGAQSHFKICTTSISSGEVGNCDQFSHLTMWIVTNCGQLSPLWQFWPIVIIWIICDNFGQKWQLWPVLTIVIGTIVLILTKCDYFDQLCQMWKLGALETILTYNENADQLWQF